MSQTYELGRVSKGMPELNKPQNQKYVLKYFGKNVDILFLLCSSSFHKFFSHKYVAP